MSEITVHSGAVPAIAATGSNTDTYEHHVWPYRLLLPIINLVAFYAHIKKFLCGAVGYHPRYNCFFGDGMSIHGARVRDGAARWPALDVIYNFDRAEGSTALRRAVDTWWMNIRNAQAVRNRLKIATFEMRKAIIAVAKPGKQVIIVSLAAGSAQGVMAAMGQCVRNGIDVRAYLLDRDTTALEYARKLAKRYGIERRVETRECDVIFFDTQIPGLKPDIIEMMGLIDYLKDRQVVRLFQRIWKQLNPQGFFFTCHVHPNSESYFMRHIINWSMKYRSRDKLEDLLVDGNFQAPRLITEPHRIHTIAISQKVV